MKFKAVTFIDSSFLNCYFEDVSSVGSSFKNCTFIDSFFYNTGECVCGCVQVWKRWSISAPLTVLLHDEVFPAGSQEKKKTLLRRRCLAHKSHSVSHWHFIWNVTSGACGKERKCLIIYGCSWCRPNYCLTSLTPVLIASLRQRPRNERDWRDRTWSSSPFFFFQVTFWLQHKRKLSAAIVRQNIQEQSSLWKDCVTQLQYSRLSPMSRRRRRKKRKSIFSERKPSWIRPSGSAGWKIVPSSVQEKCWTWKQ